MRLLASKIGSDILNLYWLSLLNADLATTYDVSTLSSIVDSSTCRSDDSMTRQSAGIRDPVSKRSTSPTTISQTLTEMVAPNLPLRTMTFSSLIKDWSCTNLLSLIQSAADAIEIMRIEAMRIEIPSISPFRPMKIPPKKAEKRAEPPTTHQSLSWHVCLIDSKIDGI